MVRWFATRAAAQRSLVAAPDFAHILCTRLGARAAPLRQAGEMRATRIDLERLIAELETVLADCHQIRHDPGKVSTEDLEDVVGKIEAALNLLKFKARRDVGTLDVENPVRGLPACSIGSCRMTAGAVVGGRELCGLHASEALRRLRT